MTKIAGSGSTSQRYGSPDPDPYPPQNFMDPEHCFQGYGSRSAWICLSRIWICICNKDPDPVSDPDSYYLTKEWKKFYRKKYNFAKGNKVF